MDWIQKRKKEADILFEKMKTMYKIPLKYSDASNLFFKSKLEAKIKLSKSSELKQLIDEWNDIFNDMQYKVPIKIGEELEHNFSDKNYILGIHRTDLSTDQILKKIFREGLSNRSNEYTSTIQTFKHFPSLLQQIINCNDYKMSQGCVIVKLPKNQKLPIYFVKDNKYYLLPEYIYGYAKVENNQIVEFIKNPSYTDLHVYNPDNYIYDECLNSDIKKTK